MKKKKKRGDGKERERESHRHILSWSKKKMKITLHHFKACLKCTEIVFTCYSFLDQRGPMGMPRQPNHVENYRLLSANCEQGSVAEDSSYRAHQTYRNQGGANI